MATALSKSSQSKPMEFRQRRPRQTANPVVSNKPDIYLEFNTSKLGIRVRGGGGDNKQGLYVAAVTNEAPPQAKDSIPEGAQIISVNEHNLEHTPFDQAVEHFAQLTLPITVRFRPPLYPPKKQTSYHSHHGHDHHHDHDHHHHCDEDDEQEGTCYIACYMILFVISFMVIVSMALNGWPGIPTSLPSMPRLFPNKGDRASRGRRGGRGGKSKDNKPDNIPNIDIKEQSVKIKEQLRQKNVNEGDNNDGGGRRLLNDIVGDMNNIHNILNDVDMNLNDIEMDDLLNLDGKQRKFN